MNILELVEQAKANPVDQKLQKARKRFSAYNLQNVDANCNDCKHLNRIQTDTKGVASPILRGLCCKKEKEVTFIANLCQLDTQGCFEHRLDGLTEEELVAKFMK